MAAADLTLLRANMIEEVLRNAGSTVSAPVIDALRTVPRHLFLPDVAPEQAYQDDAIATKLNQDGLPISSSSQPTVMALMLDQLALRPGARVLEIGTGTGYNAALMSRLVSPAGSVTTLDIDEDLVEKARANLARAGYQQVEVVRVDGAEGFARDAPYDRIIATVGVWDLAPAWLDQLAPDGRIVVPIDLEGTQHSVAFEPEDGHWAGRSVLPCGFMRLRGSFAGPERIHVLDEASELSVLVPDDGPVDRPALLGALALAPIRTATGVTASSRQLFSGLGLWLATSGLRWCTVSETGAADSARLLDAPLRFSERRVTGGILDLDGIALLANQPRSGLIVLGYGASGARLSAELAARIRSWDAAGQPATAGLHVDAYPLDTPDTALPARRILNKGNTRIALWWDAS